MADEVEVSFEDRLAEVEYELQNVETKILSLKERQEYLLKQKHSLKDEINLKKSLSLANRDWCSQEFPWSKKLKETLESVFNLSSFRPFQLQTVNAVLSKEDAILIMPTGGGKSLCYQLPALISPGTTLVVSPLVSLMEDQIFALRALNVNAAMLSASVSREEVNSLQQSMVSKDSKLKLLYVTPEKLAKSKRFMTKLQKMYEMKKLSMLAIDEVHCCSQWGHDFRPDYKFLGVLKGMFPDVPLLGLTATATSKVIVDVQKMLNVSGCLVFRASFNRPNLYYEVRQKPSKQKECFEDLVNLLKTRYAGQSGIIYATSIKDCEELMSELRSRDIRVGCYHANLDAGLRSKVHKRWLSGDYQAIVATIAFGMGIDKPNVRFVIHHSLSKSMENFYQESGRAGRDNKPAECILFYRFADVFRLSTMVFTQQTGLENLYGMVAYCLDKIRCRRSIISTHFNESWVTTDCNKMCDHCRKLREPKEAEVGDYCRSLYRIIQQAAGNDVKLTAQMLIDAWFGKGKANLRVANIKVPNFSREVGEEIIAYLLIEGYLAEDFHFTPYSTISYIKRGPRAAAVLADKSSLKMVLAGASIANSSVGNNNQNSSVSEKSFGSSSSAAKLTKGSSSTAPKASSAHKTSKEPVNSVSGKTTSEKNASSRDRSSHSSMKAFSESSTSLDITQKHESSSVTFVNLSDDDEFVPVKKKKKVIYDSDEG